jgi:glycosyltransferase involved in cell wall biosynthesis
MLAIIATHPIQYHVPLWQLLAKTGTVSFEVWYLSEHAARKSRDREFGKAFSWDLDMLAGYPHRFLETPRGATPNTPFRMRSAKPFVRLFDAHDVSHVWVLGWQVAAYWQAVWAGSKSGRRVWLRGESNAMAPVTPLKSLIKRPLLCEFFSRVDDFLCIGTANRDLYRSYKVPEAKLHTALYAVDNERFALQAKKLEDRRWEIREEWKIPGDAFCILFCGKFISKKRPMDLIEATRLLITDNSITNNRARNAHLLFVGSGEMGDQMRNACDVIFDAESPLTTDLRLPRRSQAKAGPLSTGMKPPASFAGFLNQTEVSKAYVAADALVLPSDYGETWGLVVNEAMASGLPCIISDRCGCAQDLGGLGSNAIFHFADIEALACRLRSLIDAGEDVHVPKPPSLEETSVIVRPLIGNLDYRVKA